MNLSVSERAEALRSSILSSPNTYDGAENAYYVSPDGDDGADGRSGKTAWKTLDRVNSFTGYRKGDCVLFRRGGEWRGQLNAKGGVRYSAYGEGDKPILTGSRRDIAFPSCWEETSVPNVYRCTETFDEDVGLIVFDHGRAWSTKAVVGVAGFAGSLDEMSEDLTLYHAHTPEDGALYLRSDEGNPGARFASAETAEKRHIVTVDGDDVLIDNLFIRYGGAHGVGTANRCGLTVSNCVFAWIGGSLQGINPTTRYGNAVEIYVSCRDYTVEHCLIYQIYDAGITHQFKGENSVPVIQENVRYRDNLIEYCTYSIEYFLDQTDEPSQIMRSVEISGNICRFAGYGFGHQRPDKSTPAHVKGWTHKNPAEGFRIRGNIFEESRCAMIQCCAERDCLPEFTDNLFIQREGGTFGMYGVPPTQSRPFDASLASDEKLKNNTFLSADDNRKA